MKSFSAPKRILMGPGPSDVSPRVLNALSQPTIGHLDPAFVDLMNEVKELIQYAFQTNNRLTIPVSAPGSAGMETCFMNLLDPGEAVLVCINGVFGMRMCEVAERAGAVVHKIEFPWGQPVDPDQVKTKLNELSEVKVLAFVHAETSTGVRSDAKTLCSIAQDAGCLTIVDAVTSLGGSELKVDEWGIDAIYSGTQKCLSCVPGLSPVSFSDKAAEKIKTRSSKNVSWFLDLNLVMDYWGDGSNTGAKRTYHHTAPVNSIYALHESLLILKEEGVEAAWERHSKNHSALVAGLEALGIEMLVDASCRLPQLNAIQIPEGMNDGDVRTHLLQNYNLEIGAGLGAYAGTAWRIGLMGHASSSDNVNYCIKSLGETLAHFGAENKVDPALESVKRSYLE